MGYQQLYFNPHRLAKTDKPLKAWTTTEDHSC